VFLSAAGRKEFFQEAGITLGPSMQLAQLAQTIVDGKDVQKFLNAGINGSAFLSAAGRKEFFQEAGITLGPSMQLAQLAQTTVDGESKFSFLTYLCLPLLLPRLFTTASLFAAIRFLATH
jgi:predicted NUDIX family NTP pyrophosphohydrolase